MTLYMQSPFARMARRMANAWPNPWFDEDAQPVLTFPLDVKLEEETYVLTAVLPGLKPEDLNIQVQGDTVTIRGEIKVERGEDEKYLLVERASGKFERTITLPDTLDAAESEAHMSDGILTLRIPRAEEARPKTVKVVAR